MQVLTPLAPMQRARGRLSVRLVRRDGRTRLDRLFQAGCARALTPRVDGPVPEVAILNTAGGLAGGDRIEIELEAGAGAGFLATTQAAERVYRALGGPARVATRLAVGEGAALDWLPQETILFDGGRLERRLEADLAPDARLTLLETIVLGRAAMGERVRSGALSDQWRIRRAGRLVHAEALRLSGDVANAAAGPGALGGARAFATIVRIAPGVGDLLPAAREALAPRPGVVAAASLRGEVLILRFLADDHAALRAALPPALACLRGGAPAPSLWSL